MNPNLPLLSAGPLADFVAQSTARTSFTLVLLGIAAAIALVLGLVGVYGVISYQPRQSRWPSGATLRGKAGNAFFRAPGPGRVPASDRRGYA